MFEALASGIGASADTIIESYGLRQVTDSSAIVRLIDEALAANISPAQVNALLREKLERG